MLNLSSFQVINIIFTFSALLLSIFSFIRSYKIQSKLLKLEEVHAKLSRKQLEQLTVNENNKGKTKIAISIRNGNIVLSNDGGAIADSIQLEFLKGEDNKLAKGECNKLPYPRLYPNEKFILIATYNHYSTLSIINIKVKWKNQDGSNDIHEGVIQP